MSEPATTLRSLIRNSAQRYPDNEAVVDGRFRYNYAALLDQVERMAKLLHCLGVRKGDRVALLMPACSSHVIALFGAIELSAIPCALHVRESDKILSAVLERLTPRAIIYDGLYADRVAHLRSQAPWLSASVLSCSEATPEQAISESADPVIPRDLIHYPLDFEPMPVHPEETAVIALSSGTTGIPKGIMHTHKTLLASAQCGAPYMAAHPRATNMNIFSTAFIGWYNTSLPFLYGASKIVYLSQWDPEHFLSTLEREQATVCFLVPTMWRMLLRAQPEQYDLSSLERVGYAGEPMDTATMAQLKTQFCANIINTYGTTETGSWGGCTVMTSEDYARYPDKIESVGRPGKGVEIRIVTPGGSIDDTLPPGEEGEVVFSGPSIAQELWEQPVLSRQIFQGRWWRSGDMGMLDAEGFLYLRGRLDDMIITGGINVMPGQVEEAILSHPAVSECVVIGLPSEAWGQEVTAFVVCRDKVSPEALAEHLNHSGLSSYKKPRAYRFVDELPRGNTGKVNRKLLRNQVLTQENPS